MGVERLAGYSMQYARDMSDTAYVIHERFPSTFLAFWFSGDKEYIVIEMEMEMRRDGEETTWRETQDMSRAVTACLVPPAYQL